jgi:hypothetical protein
MKKLLLATPLREGASSNYIQELMDIANRGVPGYEVQTIFIAGPSVNFARNEIAYYAVEHGFDELVQVDEDLMHWGRNLPRLMSHDVDVVGGVYCKKRPGKPTWLFTPMPKVGGVQVSDNGLIECSGIATGFLRCRVEVLNKIMRDNPERQFYAKATEQDPVSTRCDWFPMGVVGEGSHESRLRKIRELLEAGADVNQIKQVAFDYAPPGRLLGEDYYFCALARRSGFKVYADLGMGVLPHIGNSAYPITQEMVGYPKDAELEVPTAENI